MSPIKNQDFYDKMIIATDIVEEKYLVDFILHIKTYNDDDTLTFDTILDEINELEVDVAEEVFKQWEEMRFKTTNVETIICPECGFSEKYEFDALPDFFPKSWNM